MHYELKIFLYCYGFSKTVLQVELESFCKPNALSDPIVLPSPHITLIPFTNWNSFNEF